MNNKHIQELEEKIAELKKRWPAHSVPVGMMVEMDELEDELTKARELLEQEEDDA